MNHRHQRREAPSGMVPADAFGNQQSIDRATRAPSYNNRRDRFAEMGDSQSMMPFNASGDLFGPSSHHFGSRRFMPQSLFGTYRPHSTDSVFEDLSGAMMLQSQRSLNSMMGGMMSPMMGGFGDFQSGSSPTGSYSSQVMVMSSTIGPDGREHVEKYAKSSSANLNHKIRETKEAYSNTSSGVDQLAWERQLANRGRRVVKERNRDTGEILANDEIVGMSRDEECDRFNTDWNRVAQEHLPTRPQLHPSLLSYQELEHPVLARGQGGGRAQRQTRQIQAADVTDEEEQPRGSQESTRWR